MAKSSLDAILVMLACIHVQWIFISEIHEFGHNHKLVTNSVSYRQIKDSTEIYDHCVVTPYQKGFNIHCRSVSLFENFVIAFNKLFRTYCFAPNV